MGLATLRCILLTLYQMLSPHVIRTVVLVPSFGAYSVSVFREALPLMFCIISAVRRRCLPPSFRSEFYKVGQRPSVSLYTVLSILGSISFLGPSVCGTPADLGGIPPSSHACHDALAGFFVSCSAGSLPSGELFSFLRPIWPRVLARSSHFCISFRKLLVHGPLDLSSPSRVR